MTPVALLSLLLVACGTQTGPGSDPPAGVDWSSRGLAGTSGADSSAVLGVDGDRALAAMISEEGELRSTLVDPDGEVTAGEPLDTGLEPVQLGGAVPDSGWFLLGSGGTTPKSEGGELAFRAVGFRSEDGLTWEQVDVEGMAGAVEVQGLVVTDGLIVAAGHRDAAPDSVRTSPRAKVWTSTDGVTFTERPLPGTGSGSSMVSDVLVTDSGVLAIGQVGRHGAAWTSADGRSWRSVDAPLLDSVYTLGRAAARGDTVLTSVGEDGDTLLRSGDGGESWQRVDTPDRQGSRGWAPIWATDAGFLTQVGAELDHRTRLEFCYADIDRCERPQRDVALYVTAEGENWRRLDAPRLGEGAGDVVGTADGRTLVVGHTGRRDATLYSWPGDEELPTLDEPEPPEVELVLLEQGERPEPGTRYHAPMSLDCGMQRFHVGGDTWRRTDGGRDVDTRDGDRAPDGWPVADETLFGYATVDEKGTLRYSIGDGDVIATYERTEGAPRGRDRIDSYGCPGDNA